MDETDVRERAEAHAGAIAEGDLRRAGKDLTEAAMAGAGEVMKRMPGNVTAAHIMTLDGEGDSYVVTIRYDGSDGEATVESHWAEVDGRPRITAMRVV